MAIAPVLKTDVLKGTCKFESYTIRLGSKTLTIDNMNNRRKFYRVEHSTINYNEEWGFPISIGVGPYTYITAYPDITKELHKTLFDNEPSSVNPKKTRLSKIRLFSTFIDIRPVPMEDPYLRDKIGTVSIPMKNYLYGYDSIEQADKWIFDKNERLVLHTNGFHIGIYYVKDLIIGLRQSVVHKNDMILKIASMSLMESFDDKSKSNRRYVGNRSR